MEKLQNIIIDIIRRIQNKESLRGGGGGGYIPRGSVIANVFFGGLGTLKAAVSQYFIFLFFVVYLFLV